MKTILITGATSGFGMATAKLLAKDGHKLILLGRRQKRLDELKTSLQTDVLTAKIDITDKKQVADCFVSLPAAFSDIDVLINSAGLALGMDPAQEADIEDWERMVDTNITGLLRVTRSALDIMKRKGSGLIITIGSSAANIPYRGGNVYGATKAFARHFSRNLRTDLFGTGIKVTNLEPGAAETEFTSIRLNDAKKAKDFYHGWHPLLPEDIAKTIQWVIDQPAHVNIENIELMPLDQTYAGLAINKIV